MPSSSSPISDVLTGLALRCPNCHEGRMFEPFSSHMHDVCAVCGVGFERARGEFTGAMMAMLGMTGIIALMGWFILFIFLEVPAWVHYSWLVFFALVFPVAFYRNVKGAWVGLVHVGAGLRTYGAPSEDAPPRTP